MVGRRIGGCRWCLCGGCSCFCMIFVMVIVVNIFDMVVGFFVRLEMVVCVWFGAAVCMCGGGSVVLFCFLQLC